MPTSPNPHPDGAARRRGIGSGARRRVQSLSRSVERRGGTGTEAPWRLRNWSLRTKLIVVLLIPTLTATVLIGLRFNSLLASANHLDQLSARAAADTSVAALVHALQRERDRTVHHIAVQRQGGNEELKAQHKRVDEASARFGKVLAEVEPDLADGSARSLESLRTRLEALPRLRYGSEHAAYPADAVLRSYSELISAMLSERERSVVTINEPELVRLQMAGTALARVKEQMSVTRALVDEALHEGEFAQDRKRLLDAANAEVAAWKMDFRKFATPEQQRMYDDTVTGLIVDVRNDILESVLVRTETGQSFDGLDHAQWDTAATYTANLARQVEEAVLVRMQSRTDALASSASSAALRDGAIVAGLLLLAILLTGVIARSLIRPLRTLRSNALEVAEYRLPAAVHGLLADPAAARRAEVAPVPVRSSEEVGQVARAFDAVHGEAIRLAADQAELRANVNEMFINLSRRGQELADRQLGVLDKMEAAESDPDTLAALFELDHLATRSRRILENILVLTGNDFARMLPGSVAASEVLGAALSEIEEYQRVELADVPEVAIRGDAVSDVVHVISELLENATNGSGADTTVSVTSSVKKGGSWLVEITDRGPGMSPDAIDGVNARLAEPLEIDVEASRRMGFYVVARLAQRHGIDVRLRAARSGGLTASVLVPAELIGEMSADVAPTPAAEPGRRPDWLEQAVPRPQAEPGGPMPAGPPKRAPVVGAPAMASIEGRDGADPLEDDTPTERMPAYRDLLTRWFKEGPGGPGETPSADAGSGDDEQSERVDGADHLDPAPDVVDVEQDDWAAIDPPTVRSTPRAHAAKGVNSGSDSSRVSRGDFAPPVRGELDLSGDRRNGHSHQDASTNDNGFGLVETGFHVRQRKLVNGDATRVISRAPEDVRNRMGSLAEGVRRARQARSGEYPEAFGRLRAARRSGVEP